MDLTRLKQKISSGNAEAFYDSAEWLEVRKGIIALDHHQCAKCGKIFRDDSEAVVHHVAHLKDRPELALAARNPATGERQLITLCRSCHAKEHPENWRPKPWWRHGPRKERLTEERWD